MRTVGLMSGWSRGCIGSKTRGEREVAVGMNPGVDAGDVGRGTKIGVCDMAKLTASTEGTALALRDEVEASRATFKRRRSRVLGTRC